MSAHGTSRRCEFCGAELVDDEVRLPGFGLVPRHAMCGCAGAVAARQAEAREREVAERVRAFAEVWERAGIPEEFAHVDADFDHADALDANRSLYVTGKNGRGKTRLACQVAKGFLSRHTTRWMGEVRCRRSLRFVTAQDVDAMLRSSWHRWDETEEDVFSRLVGVDLLVLDDFGKGRPGEWNAEALFRIIDRRWAEHRPMVITSQYDTAALAARYGAASDETVDAMLSRLRGWCDGVTLTGPDHRLGGGAR